MVKQTTLRRWRRGTSGNIVKNVSDNVANRDNDIPEDRQSSTTHANLIQTTLQEHNPIEFQYETWGSSIQIKPAGTIRIALRNISSLPKVSIHNKNDILINEVMSSLSDIYCSTEVNLAWQHIEYHNNINERFKGKFEFSKFVTSNNRDPGFKGTFQPGGTLMIANGNICGRIIGVGKEEHTLQRWSWMKIRGKDNKRLIVVTMYRPVVAQGPLSCYQQHKLVLLNNDEDTCPRKNILDSLAIQIEIWKQEGYSIIISGDFNEDVTGKNISHFFSQFNMKEIIIHQQDTTAPNTMIKGSKPIDGIFSTNDIHAVQSGYSSFAWGMATDHRLLWVDINCHQVLGTTKPPMWKPQTRRLKCNDPTIVLQFNKLRTKYMNQKDGIQLYKTIQNMITTNQVGWEPLLEELDIIRVQSIQYADRHCRRLKMGLVPWSPKIQEVMNKITYLQRCRLKYINGYRIQSRTLLQSFTKSGYTTQFTTPQEIILQLKNEFKSYKELKHEAAKLRYNFLESLAEAQSLASNEKKEKIYQRLRQVETIRNMFRKIKYSIKDSRNGVTIIEAPVEDGLWKVVTEKTEIENKCIQENIRRLTQASTTPSMQSDQLQIFGNTAITERARQVLDGSITNMEGIHPDIQCMIPYLHTPEAIQNDSIRTDITTDEYKWMWHRSREFTSTGMSGLHFGHFIASCNDNQLLEIDKYMMQVSLQSGYTLKRWNKGIDVMIPKKVDSIRVDKLRTIVLLEPDFNFLNKLIGKRVMAMAEKNNTMAPEQFGSRKRKSSIIHALNKQLTCDILRQDKKSFSLMVLDAKSCYDRITPLYASMSMKRQGATDEMMNIIFNPIKNMEHHIRTSFGDSEQTYKPVNDTFHGILQGNGAGPTIWATMSSTMLDKQRDRGMGVLITTQSGETILIPAYAFVDDNDLLQELLSDTDITSPQKAVDEWVQGLRTSGGLLVPDKCSFQIIRYVWKNNKFTINDQLDDIAITIPNEKGEPIPIKQNLPSFGEMALGIAFSPAGNMNEEVQYLRHKTSTWAEKIMKAPLTAYEAWTALRTTIFKTVEYALPVTTFTKREMNYIISPALNIGLAKAGICRKISRKIIYASNKYQGFGMKDPYITQGIRKLEILFDKNNVMTQTLVHESWSRLCQECGSGPNVLLLSYKKYKSIVTPSWFSSLWEFLDDTKIQLYRIEIHPQLRMIDDSYLVKSLMERTDFSVKEQQEFNMCRLYLKVELLSDIVTANGMKIRTQMLCGDITIATEQSVTHQMVIPKPTASAWKTWRTVLTKLYNLDPQGNLRTPISPISNTSRWQWFFNPSTDRIYRNIYHQWQLYTVHSNGSRTRNKTYRYRQTINPPMHTILPITVYQQGNNVKIDGIGTITTKYEFDEQTEWCDTINTVINGNETELLEYFERESIILMSDATVQDENGFAAWIVTTPNAYGMGHYIEGYGKVFETKIDSHRAECFGILGAIFTFNKIKTKLRQNSTRSIIITCDNQSALYFACNTQRYHQLSSRIPDFDVLSTIRHLLKGVHYTYMHVKGHQDRSARPWTIYTTLNIEVDLLASDAIEKWESMGTRSTSYTYLKGEEWQIWVNDEKIYKHMDSQIRDYISEQTLPPVWHKYNRIQETWFGEVDWTAMGRAMKLSTIPVRHWIIKRAARDCGAHAILFRRKEREDDKCPFCDQVETVEHVYQCQHRQVRDQWNKSLQDFEKYLIDINTDPNIINQMIDGLQTWQQNLPTAYCTMTFDQAQIGWNGILEGVIGKHWAEEQQVYGIDNSTACNAKKWSHLIIRRLWKIAWEMWEHRNTEAHKHDVQHEKERLLHQLAEELALGSQGYQELKVLLTDKEIDRVREGNVSYMTSWLRLIQARRKRLERMQNSDKYMIRMRNTMRQFLTIT